MASSPQPGPQIEKALTTSPPPISADAQKRVHIQDRVSTDTDSEEPEEQNTSLFMRTVRSILGWMTPYEQMTFLRRKRDLKRWELFRDSLMRRWSNLNVICGLIMGAVSTIVFADFPLSRASFTLGIISLLSSLIAIGFGVGLIYVLGDVRGSSIVMVDDRYPRLHLFALSIPEIWAFLSFGSFFADVSVIVWEADNEGWIVKAGVTAAAVALVGHLIAFGFLFREQDTTQYLIPDEPVFPTDESKTKADADADTGQSSTSSPSHPRDQSQYQSQSLGGLQSSPKEFAFDSTETATLTSKRIPTRQDNIPSSHQTSSTSYPASINSTLNDSKQPRMTFSSSSSSSFGLRSSETLVASPGSQGQISISSRVQPPLRASTVPVPVYVVPRNDERMQRSLHGFVMNPAGEVASAGSKRDIE